MKGIVVAAEMWDEELDSTFELVRYGRRLANDFDEPLVVVPTGKTADADATLSSLLGKGVLSVADEFVDVDSGLLLEGNPAVNEGLLSRIFTERRPRVVLVAQTPHGLDIAPAVAARTDSSYYGNCVELSRVGSGLRAVRAVYEGKMHEVHELPADRPAVVSVQPSAIPDPGGLSAEAEPTRTDPSVVEWSVEDELTVRVVENREPDRTDVDVSEAEVLVAGGMGVGSEDNLDLLFELASALDGAVACTKPLVDLGWLPKARQVGITGERVEPRLYVACGISGQREHVDGMREAETIVAVNTDEQAPIFDVADYGIVGDLSEVLPVFTRRVTEEG